MVSDWLAVLCPRQIMYLVVQADWGGVGRKGPTLAAEGLKWINVVLISRGGCYSGSRQYLHAVCVDFSKCVCVCVVWKCWYCTLFPLLLCVFDGFAFFYFLNDRADFSLEDHSGGCWPHKEGDTDMNKQPIRSRYLAAISPSHCSLNMLSSSCRSA